jgi:hypothetical protein
MTWDEAVPGLVLDPWRFDPSAAIEAVNLAIAGGRNLVQDWVDNAAGVEQATASTIVARLVTDPAPVLGRADTFRSDAPGIPHFPFLFSDDVPFLPASTLAVGGAALGPQDFVRSCLANGEFRLTPLAPSDPREAADKLIDSPEWLAVIDPIAQGSAALMVRWQAARALGRPELLEEIEPTAAGSELVEAWWAKVSESG